MASFQENWLIFSGGSAALTWSVCLFACQDDKESSSKDQTTPGKPSRETLEWHPDKLLCKRFNVPDPFPG